MTGADPQLPRPGPGARGPERPTEVPTNESPRQAPSDETTGAGVPPMVRAGNRALEVTEGVVYAGIAAFLLVLALGAFVIAARQVPSLFSPDSAAQSALEILDTLLLVFIVVELLFAVRITIAKRELIAEPFLLVGIIASIKEIVVVSVKAADEIGTGTSFSVRCGKSACSACWCCCSASRPCCCDVRNANRGRVTSKARTGPTGPANRPGESPPGSRCPGGLPGPRRGTEQPGRRPRAGRKPGP